MFRKGKTPNEQVTTTFYIHDYEHKGDYNDAIADAKRIIGEFDIISTYQDGNRLDVEIQLCVKDILKALKLKTIYDMPFFLSGSFKPIEIADYFDEFDRCEDLPKFKGKLHTFRLCDNDIITYKELRNYLYEELFDEMGVKHSPYRDNQKRGFSYFDYNGYQYGVNINRSELYFYDLYKFIKTNGKDCSSIVEKEKI